jgi:hypothetical protein
MIPAAENAGDEPPALVLVLRLRARPARWRTQGYGEAHPKATGCYRHLCLDQHLQTAKHSSHSTVSYVHINHESHGMVELASASDPPMNHTVACTSVQLVTESTFYLHQPTVAKFVV